MKFRSKISKFAFGLILIWAAAPIQVSANADSVSSATPILFLSLEDCRSLALQNNPYVKNAELDVLAARAQKREALAEYFPSVSAQAFAFYAFDPMLEIGLSDILGNSENAQALVNIADALGERFDINTSYSTLKRGLTATVSATQPIFAGGRIYNGNRLASLGLQAAGLQSQIQKRSATQDVEQSYWQVVALEEKYLFLDMVEELLDTLYKDVSAAVDAGVTTDTDLLQVQLKRNELKTNRIQLRSGIRLAKMNLCNSIGVSYNPYLTLRNDSIPHIDDICLTDRLEELPEPASFYVSEETVAAGQEEMQLLDLSVESKRLEKKMALGEALPSLGVGVSYGYNDFINRGSFNGAVYGVLKIPISDWGKTSRKMQRLDYQMQKAENEREYLQDQLVLQVHKLWLDLNTAYENWQLAEESALTVEALERQMHQHYMAGMVAVSELLQVQTQLAEARNKAVDSKIEYKLALRAYLDRTE